MWAASCIGKCNRIRAENCSVRSGGGYMTFAKSAQLRILAAAAIVAAEHALLLVLRALAFDAQPHARHGLAPREWNGRAAFGADFEPGAFAASAARTRDRVCDRR